MTTHYEVIATLYGEENIRNPIILHANYKFLKSKIETYASLFNFRLELLLFTVLKQ